MITNKGRQIVGKFLLSQAPDFATHIVAGVGADALYPNQAISASTMAATKSLEFEAFRVPIIARGFIKENGVEKIVLKAEMPSASQYRITEVGFYPDSSNSLARGFDSRTLAVFSPTESWTVASSTSSSAVAAVSSSALVRDVDGDIIWSGGPAFILSNADALYDVTQRILKHEEPRLADYSLFVTGSSGFINEDFSTASAAYRIENSKISYNLSQSLPSDEIRLAFSVVGRSRGSSNPHRVRIVLDMVNNVSSTNLESPKARATLEFVAADFVQTGTGEISDPSSRYKIAKIPLSDFAVDDGFSWSSVTLTRIYACVLDASEQLDDDYLVLFDGLRLENLTTENPLYALCGYDIVRTDSGVPVLKSQSSLNYIEYRFGVEVA